MASHPYCLVNFDENRVHKVYLVLILPANRTKRCYIATIKLKKHHMQISLNVKLKHNFPDHAINNFLAEKAENS